MAAIVGVLSAYLVSPFHPKFLINHPVFLKNTLYLYFVCQITCMSPAELEKGVLVKSWFLQSNVFISIGSIGFHRFQV